MVNEIVDKENWTRDEKNKEHRPKDHRPWNKWKRST